MTRLSILVLGALGAGFAACARPEPAVAPRSVPSTAAPAAPGQTFAAPAPSPAQRDAAALAAACRSEADRIIALRDRGQLLREEERDARLGSDASIYDLRVPIDRLGRQFARDQVMDECILQNQQTTPRR